MDNFNSYIRGSNCIPVCDGKRVEEGKPESGIKLGPDCGLMSDRNLETSVEGVNFAITYISDTDKIVVDEVNDGVWTRRAEFKMPKMSNSIDKGELERLRFEDQLGEYESMLNAMRRKNMDHDFSNANVGDRVVLLKGAEYFKGKIEKIEKDDNPYKIFVSFEKGPLDFGWFTDDGRDSISSKKHLPSLFKDPDYCENKEKTKSDFVKYHFKAFENEISTTRILEENKNAYFVMVITEGSDDVFLFVNNKTRTRKMYEKSEHISRIDSSVHPQFKLAFKFNKDLIGRVIELVKMKMTLEKKRKLRVDVLSWE